MIRLIPPQGAYDTIEYLVKKFKELPARARQQYNEDNTRKDFVLPLFRALEWNIDDMREVVHYIKNQSLGFTIPYAIEGEEKSYVPDFLVRVEDGYGRDDLLNLVLEVSGEARKDKAAKVSTARNLWVPAINNHGGFGRWKFLEITDPWDAQNTIRGYLHDTTVASGESSFSSPRGGKEQI